VGVDAEEIVQPFAEGEAAERPVSSAVLGPDEEQRRAGLVFPPHHEIGAELTEIEIGIVESIELRPTRALIDDVLVFVRVEVNLIR